MHSGVEDVVGVVNGSLLSAAKGVHEANTAGKAAQKQAEGSGALC